MYVAAFAPFAKALVEFADQADPEFVIPEDLTVLSDSDLTDLHAQAVTHFDSLYGDGKGLSADDVAALSLLTQGIEALQTELSTREAAESERAEEAAALASRIRPEAEATDADADAEAELAEDAESADEAVEVEAGAELAADEQPETDLVAGAAKREFRVPLAGVRSRARVPERSTEAPSTMSDMVLAADVPGFAAGQGLDWNGVGRAIDRRLTGFNPAQYAQAAKNGRHLREQHGVALLRKPMDPELTIQSSDPEHVDSVMRRAMDETRLPGGSLVASGGWCAPSETLYSMMELESRDGLFSVPEVGIARGGINVTPGPTFSDLYDGVTSWDYTEAEDAAGDYDGIGGGTKPVYTVGCPTFTEERLNTFGMAIASGLLQQRGYPEMLARTTRGALIAHDHKLSGTVISAIVAGSDAVTMPTKIGSVAPVLEAVDLQVEHYRYIHRLGRNVTLEAAFPFWIVANFRADLALRNGVDIQSVSQGDVVGWFALRGVNVQFVYNWQDITGTAAGATAWAATVDFLLYTAGTWVKGGADVITLDTIYDSVLLGTNDYTALFTEEGYLVAKMGHDSRVVTVPLGANGATSAPVSLDPDGTPSV